MPVLVDTDSSAQPGRVLGGKYRVERVLGMGGMGVVVAARHVTLNTRFALKLMKREALRDEASIERFLREARATVKLRSQHCVRVLDVGQLEDGAPYMVMELLVGKDLGQLVAESGARSPAEAVDYVLQACQGIAEAHAHGIIHRDIKPQNLFVTRGVDGMPLVKVLDFGLAKSTKMTSEARALTNTATVMGSPMYMSPEQMRASRSLDERSDIWSLGVCLYELLTGRPPFDGSTFPELCSMVLDKAPGPMPSDIPRGLSRVIARCLQKDPRRRYDDVAELAEALDEFASMPGMARQVRAVLEAPRLELDSTPGQPLHDPTADTKTAASIDTTKRRESGAWVGMSVVRRAGVASVAVGAGLALVLGIAMRALAPSPSFAVPGPAPEPIAVSLQPPVALSPVAPVDPVDPVGSVDPVSVGPISLGPISAGPFASATPAPAPGAAGPVTSKPAQGRGAAGHRAPSPTLAPPPTPTAVPKSTASVLVPKTTEF